MNQAQKIKEQIQQLEFLLEKIQTNCQHTKATFKYESDTGNYDPSVDSYWIQLKCPTCLKRWTVSSDCEDYRTLGSILKEEK